MVVTFLKFLNLFFVERSYKVRFYTWNLRWGGGSAKVIWWAAADTPQKRGRFEISEPIMIFRLRRLGRWDTDVALFPLNTKARIKGITTIPLRFILGSRGEGNFP